MELKRPQAAATKGSLKRKRTPTVLQMEAVECGAAALGSVLGYWGRIVPLEVLRVDAGVSRDGSKASNVLKAAREYGLECRGLKTTVAGLRDLPRPSILFWNFNHFVVLEGYGRNKVHINDPASGPRTVGNEEFDASFTGVVLTFKPGPQFEKGGEKPSMIGALAPRLRGSEAAVSFALLAGLALVVPGLVIPTFSRIFVDNILVDRQIGWLRPLIVGMAITAVLRMALMALQKYYLLRLETKLSITSSSRFLWHILRLPMEFYAQRFGGEVASRVVINDRIAAFLSGELAVRFIDALMVIFFFALMLTYDVSLTLVGGAAVALIVSATILVNRRRVDTNSRLLIEQGKAYGTLMGGLANLESLKASGTESDLFSRWAGYEAKFINAHQELGNTTQSFLALPPLLTALTNSTVLALGAYRVMEGDMTMGMLVAYQSLMSSFLSPVNNLVSLASNLQEMNGSMRRLDDVLRYDVDPQTCGDEGPEPQARKLEGFVELAGVTFGYSRLEPPLIEAFNLELSPGRRVALVGSSGSGKSTIANLVAGLYEPWEGEVRFDGSPRRQLPRSVIANSVAMVNQDITLFEGSVRDNLTLWDQTLPEPIVVKACKDACIHDDVNAREGGYNSQVSEGGRNFSGGQAQRLEIARSLVGNPRILVLDEATSALDAVTEQLIDRNLRQRGCTCLIVAHRLSTIRDADEIIVLDRGKVVQRGTHEELAADPQGLYAQLVHES
jgi:NHLM bacteriocin system ABC transporter peptidase/ATP-binding protein